MKVKKILTMTLTTAMILRMTNNILIPNTVYAKESAETVSTEFLGDHKTVGTAETADIVSFSLDESQMTEEQHNKYEQAMSGEQHVLEVGESLLIGSDDEGDIYITCVSSSTSLARASWETANQSYNITKEIQGVKTVVAKVDLECLYYKNGIDGYIRKLTGNFTEKHSAWKCSWNDYKVAMAYSHKLWLDISSAASTYSVMMGADYNPLSEALTFSIGDIP